ncbi:hypothetical protein TruAng_005611 [Truncatella angustata]|nr:hypothetical protein TruAng_005611 [Truncatella angustata]
MTSKESHIVGPRSSSFDLEEYESDTQDLLDQERNTNRFKQQRKRNWIFFVLNAFILLLNIGVLLMISVPKIVSVAEDAQVVHLPYADYTIRVPQAYSRNPSSPASIITEFQDEKGGVMGTFSYLHNLHCLKTIRHYILRDYYPKAAELYKPTPEEPIPEHIDHCIDILRQSELCHADMSLVIFEWHENEEKPVNLHHSQHVCAKPDNLNKFLEANSVPPLGHILVNPWTGRNPF